MNGTNKSKVRHGTGTAKSSRKSGGGYSHGKAKPSYKHVPDPKQPK